MESREKIIRTLLREKKFISGEQLAQDLNISRTAIWKHIKKIRQMGIEVVSRAREGYKIAFLPDRLLPILIRAGLKSDSIGKQIIYFERTGSTNDVAKQEAALGAEEGTLVIAEEQSSGRGRMGRTWISPPCKNILMSIIFRPCIPTTQVFYLTMITSLGLCKILRRNYGIDAKIKWPNDVYVGGRKIAGILTEFSGDSDAVNYAVVGIGLNVNVDTSHIPEISGLSTSVLRELRREVNRLDLLTDTINQIGEEYMRFRRGESEKIYEDWVALSLIMGANVTVTSQDHIEEGVVKGFEKEGNLVLIDDSGKEKRIVSGDVSLRVKGSI
ncbi:MAG: biotin--[acetyl-CoA-carboxylase] ligase [Thermodesulfobacteriota bacterium]|nr:biotin--[acetyl-CoA-carboxylase] ligase [Thermodesulfobacteriota bacterium]